MNARLLLLLIILIPATLMSQSTKKVLILGIDGCRPDALIDADTPNIDGLIGNGLFSPDAMNEDITGSGPGWSAILTGVWSDKHLVVDNTFNGNDLDTYPHFFKHIDDFDTSLTTISICNWSPINTYIVQDHADISIDAASDSVVAAEAVANIGLNDPDVLFLAFDDPDHAGHNYGFSIDVPEYISAIESVDTHIGDVLEAIEQRPTYLDEDWLVIVTTDHGGAGFGHFGVGFEAARVFMVASGDNIMTDVILVDSLVVPEDIQNCLGDTIELRFDGSGDNVEIAPAPIFDFGTSQDFTVECRVRVSDEGDWSIVGDKDWESGFNKGFVFSFDFSPNWKVNIGDGTSRADINTGGSIDDNEWHTLGASFDRDGLMKMYLDGAIVDSTDISFIGDISTGDGLFFGTDINGDFSYSGAIAEVRIWDTIIDDQTIANWYCTTVDVSHANYSNLLGHWKMNEGVGNNVLDHSIHGNDGVINGAAWASPDSILVLDYSATPRLTDVVPTVMDHLCIPIETNWELEGSSLITTNCQGDSMSRALYVDGFSDILGVEIAENSLLEYAQSNEMVTLLLYDLHIVNANYDLSDPVENQILADFISKAKTDYGILEVGATAESGGFFTDVIDVYNNTRSIPLEKFDIYNLEFEYWSAADTEPGGYYCTTYLEPNNIPCTENGAFQFFISTLQTMSSLAANNTYDISTEAYVGWPTAGQADTIGSNLDKLRLHAYVTDPATAFSYSEDRLIDFANGNPGLDVSIIFSSESDFMKDWLEANSILGAESIFTADYTTMSAGWPSNISLDGFTYFTYSEMDNTAVSIESDYTDRADLAKVFPTLVDDKITIESTVAIDQIMFFDTYGRKIKTIKGMSHAGISQVDLSELSEGLYVVVLDFNSQLETFKFIKKGRN